MELLTHRTFYEMIRSGAKQVIYHKKELNAINMFPVPDGDTGSNLSYLMEMILRETKWQEPSIITLEQIKTACLRGSRGNSGTIFSQFIITMCNYLLKQSELKESHFLEMCEQSVQTAYQSVASPQDGTILTVMKTWVNVMKELSPRPTSIRTIIKNSMQEVHAALENTTNQLEVLKINNVVDAGAKGFVHFLQGTLASGEKTSEEAAGDNTLQGGWLEAAAGFVDEHSHSLSKEQVLQFRYCCEFLFELDEHSDIPFIQKKCSQAGDSMVFVSDNRQGKVHLHTNNPAQVAELLASAGRIRYQKVEDMRRQYEMIYERKSRIALVVDSACDLPQEFMDQHHIHLLPLHLQMGDSAYLDKVTLHPDAFYAKLEQSSEQPRTSQPTLDSIKLLYEQLVQHYDQVIAVHLSKELSGTFEASCLAAQQVAPDRIQVINSQTLSGSYGLLVYLTAELIAQGKSAEEAVGALQQWIKRAEILVSVPTLKYMIRGGRVSPLQGKVANLLNMKPIVSIDAEGRSKLYGKTFFARSNVKKMFQMIRYIHQSNKIEQYVILHAGAPDKVDYCQRSMEFITGCKPLYISEVAPVIGSNAGRGAVSIAMILTNDNKRGAK